ncbi:uncharacterized protein BP01DRAFT_306765 [Aspergillus saccharolyticus JOP 1030-1]|uniref:Uncharacterized protein n=1 Tax=Aspergillus saccharolyticus JOP 1030-1 TaxID=1450539 RepID=A0A318Z223_9EURO|nr:hypothetical protein BP01DRAFT_306765 [Aspergillus saccharolyticus JOP 1030-1]PYH41106.1 hypothetical protein BP01DRAFT_306765 [Aspergillus saccharolyticus JOP 1030-1]
MRGLFTLSLLSAALGASAGLTASNLETYVDVLALDNSFNPIEAAYWTNFAHHRRTPFAVSPNGKTAYLAYLDSSGTDVHVTELDPTTFKATGTSVTVSAGGLVAHDDGFALLTNEAMPSGTTNAPPSDTPVPVLHRYTNGNQTWKTWLGGPGVHASDGLAEAVDMNGDLVYSEAAGMYGAYFVVSDYTGSAAGHYGDSIEYVAANGTLLDISGASSSWGCSHNTGIAFEAADEPPFASICAEDQGAIWLNTKTQSMYNTGVKISNENTTNGGSGEPMGGMSGSYSGLARFADSSRYIFTWVSRGAMDVTENTWMGDGYTHVTNRTNPRNVALALFSDKYTKVGAQATSTVGAEDGDSQVTWVTSGANDCSNAHTATFGNTSALITWEEISDPVCDYIAMGCEGKFAGTYFQQVDATGKKVGDAFSSSDVYIAGDMVTMSDDRICWPYVSMEWDLSLVVYEADSSKFTKKISFACMSTSGASASSSSSSSAVAAASSIASVSPSQVAATSSAAAVFVETTTAAAAAAAAAETTVAHTAIISSVAPVATEAQVASSASQIPSWATVAGQRTTLSTQGQSKPTGGWNEGSVPNWQPWSEEQEGSCSY